MVNVLIDFTLIALCIFLLAYYGLVIIGLVVGAYETKRDILIDLLPFGGIVELIWEDFKKLD